MKVGYRGGCLCGAVRFALETEPMYACHCHCHSCQKAAGAPFVTWATFSDRGLSLAAGPIAEYRSSPGVTRGFCAECGTTLSYAHVDRPGEIDITLASLDEPGRISPLSHIWLEDKAPWLAIGDELPQFAQKVASQAS
jgi:hypothetical protein